MKFKKLLLAILSVSLVMITGCEGINLGVYNGINGDAKQISNEEKLKEVFARNRQNYGYYDYLGGVKNDAAVSSAAESATGGHSETNVQVAGVDEGDIVKVDGNYIYKMQSNGFVILQVQNDGTLIESSKIVIENYSPLEMYINENQLIIVGGTYETINYNINATNAEPGLYIDCFRYHTSVDVRVYDISDRANIVEEQQVAIDGYYVTSRRIDDTFYLVNNYYEYYYGYYYPQTDGGTSKDGTIVSSSVSSETDSNVPIPSISVDGEDAKPIDYDDIYYYENCIGYNYLNLVKIDLNNVEEVVVKSYLANYAGNIYVSANYIYTALTSYEYETLPFVGTVNYTILTNVQRYSLDTLLNDITYKAPGYIKDRYSMDEYNGYFRIAVTNSNGSESSSGVYVFDDKAVLVGKVENLAPGEMIYSARFDKTLAYIVTYRMTDPLYVIDMSNVTDLKVTSELKKDGVSLYLHNFEDGKRMLGIGYNTVDGRMTGLEVVLYNIENKEATVIQDRYLTNNRSVYLEAMYNPKALLFMESENLFGFNLEEYYYDNVDYSQSYSTQGYYVFKINEEGKFDVTILSNIEPFYYQDYTENYDYNDYMVRYQQYITRGVVIGDYLYTISDTVIGIYTLDELSLVGKFNSITQ